MLYLKRERTVGFVERKDKGNLFIVPPKNSERESILGNPNQYSR
jgi:hypothetical protein